MFLLACKLGTLTEDEYQEMFDIAESVSKKELRDTHQQLLEIVTDPSSLEAIARFYATKKPKLATDFATEAMRHALNTDYDAMPLLELVMELSSKFTAEDRTNKFTKIAKYLGAKGKILRRDYLIMDRASSFNKLFGRK